MRDPTPAQLKNAQERNKPIKMKPMGMKPKGKETLSTKTLPKVIQNSQPVQEEFPFALQYNTTARVELEKDMVSLMELLDKFGCHPANIDTIVSMIQGSSSRFQMQKDAREIEKRKAAEAKKKADALRVPSKN